MGKTTYIEKVQSCWVAPLHPLSYKTRAPIKMQHNVHDKLVKNKNCINELLQNDL